MAEDIKTYKGSKEELMVEVEGLALRFVDLINRADGYDLENLDAAGVWFIIGQSYALMHQAKRLLKGESSKEVAADWRKLMEEETDELAAAHRAVAMLNSMILSGEKHSDQSRKVVVDVLKTED